jgi:hypothetical protein
MVKLQREYTGAELEALATEQVEKLINLECADAGIAFDPEPPTPFEPLKLVNDTTLYGVSGTNILVASRVEAEQISDNLRKYKLWKHEVNWTFGYELVAEPSDCGLEVQKVEARSIGQMKQYKDQIILNNAAKKRFEEESNKYAEIVQQRGKVAESVWRVIQEAWEFKAQRESLIRKLQGCIGLAEGDIKIGLRFFEKANADYSTYFTAEIDGEGCLVRTDKYFQNPENEGV